MKKLAILGLVALLACKSDPKPTATAPSATGASPKPSL